MEQVILSSLLLKDMSSKIISLFFSSLLINLYIPFSLRRTTRHTKLNHTKPTNKQNNNKQTQSLKKSRHTRVKLGEVLKLRIRLSFPGEKNKVHFLWVIRQKQQARILVRKMSSSFFGNSEGIEIIWEKYVQWLLI